MLEGGFAEGHHVVGAKYSSLTDVGVSENIMSGLIIQDESGRDVTYMYNIQYEYGILEVTGRQITVRTESASKSYDGEPLRCEEFTLVGELPEGFRIEVEFSGEQTELGRCQNTVKSVRIYDAEGRDVTLNFIIEIVCGTLKVT